MQLHVCLLLLLITTDKALAWPQRLCGGDVSLDQEPVGRIHLPLPDHNNTLSSMKHPSRCTWRINPPPGRTLRLKVEELDGGSSVSVRCVRHKEDQDQVLERGGTALLSGCVGNKATLSWTGIANTSHALQLSYHVHEDERNSSEDHTNPQSDRDATRWPQTGTSFTSTAPVDQKTARGTDGVRGQVREDLKWGPTLQSLSGSTSKDQGLLHPTSPQQALSVAGRGTLPLPEEAQNNGADTSGPAHRTDGPISATHTYFQRTARTDTSNTETYSSTELRQTRLAQTDAAYKHAVSRTPKHTTTHTPPTPSSSNIPPRTSTHPELLSQASWRTASSLLPHGGAVGGTHGEVQSNSWRSQRSTHRLSSDLTSAVTSDPLRSPSGPLLVDRSSARADGETTDSSTSSQALARTRQSDAAASTMAPASFHPNTSGSDSFEAAASEVSGRTRAFFDDTAKPLHTPTSPNSPRSADSPTHTPHTFTQAPTTAESTHKNHINTHTNTKAVSSSPVITKVKDRALTIAGSSSTPRAAPTLQDVQDSAATATTTQANTLLHPSAPPPTLRTHTTISGRSRASHTPTPLTSAAESSTHTAAAGIRTVFTSSPPSTITSTSSHTHLLSSTNVPATHKQPHDYITTTHTPLLPLTTGQSHYGHGDREPESEDATTHTTTSGPTWPPPAWTSPHPSPGSKVALTPSALTSAPTRTAATGQTPKFYIVPDQPATVRVETIELLLQIIVEQSRSALAAGLEEDTTAWVEPYLQKAPGFHRLLGVWSSGRAVQILVEFETSGALQWLAMTGPTSLLERTGLSQAVREGRGFRWSKITNVTVGGLQGDVCDWLLLCPAGYKCVSQHGTANYNCSSVCHFDHCHHHGICTHHPGQLPVCHCLAGEDFWYMGQRCDVKMTRARLVGSCLAVLVIVVTIIGVLAFVAVRRYRAILIQAKVDQTRSSYRRFNHFDELSGRFWLRSWAGSADSMDNPAFTRSDELLHLRALDRPCCYHDDTLSVASTCPSHATHINTIYPHSSQYGWRGSEMSMGDGVLDSGKVSDLSVCSWPVEPIHWTPFPLLQQLASHRTPTVRVSRPRSYCEGMELVDLGKSWTA